LDAQLWKIKHASEVEADGHWTEKIYGPSKKFLLTNKYLAGGEMKIILGCDTAYKTQRFNRLERRN
jgi:hypothetical protein